MRGAGRALAAATAAMSFFILGACGSGQVTKQKDDPDEPEPRAPVALDPGLTSVDEDSSIEISLTGSDAESVEADLVVEVVILPTHGALDVTSGAAPLSVTYLPDADYFGFDTLGFTVADPDGLISDPVTVDVYVAPVNDAPVAQDDTGLSTDSVTPLNIDVLANDTDPDDLWLVVSDFTAPEHGEVTRAAGQALLYTPVHPHEGSFSFTYTIRDPAGATDTATVTVSVTLATTPTITSFVASREAVGAGGEVELSWTSVATTSCSINNGVDIGGATSGAATVNPTESITYTLTCRAGTDLVDTAEVTIAVLEDSDGDGLIDLLEIALGTDPNEPDSDHDGILDGVEDTNQNGLVDPDESDPRVVDTDGDGLDDGLEDANHNGLVDFGETHPADADSDDDGLDDGVEDADHDGVVDPGELDPFLTDTDGNGVPDGLDDQDGDQLSNLAEMAGGTGLYDPDSDDDGLSDGDEDLDRDGVEDPFETDPLDADSAEDNVCDSFRADNEGDGLDVDDDCTNPRVFFVDGAAAGAGDGSSWEDAFPTFSALAAGAALQSTDQVWVARGTYRAAGAGQPVVYLAAGVRYYGGFAGLAGTGEKSVAERPRPLVPSVLSGDQNEDGELSTGDSYHVIWGASNAVLDGFNVVGGNAGSSGTDRFGAGIYNSAVSNLKVFNTAFMGHYGNGMYNSNSSVVMVNVSFVGNVCPANNLGAGLYNTASSLEMVRGSFLGNGGAVAYGGGAYLVSTPTATFTNVVFKGNQAWQRGAGLCSDNSSPILTNVRFEENRGGNRGGGMYNSGSSPWLMNVAFIRNAADQGGGMYNQSTAAALANVSFVGNWATEGGGLYNSVGATPTLTNVSFRGNRSREGGAVHNANNAAPTLVNAALWDNGDGIVNTDTATLDATFSCSAQDLSGFGVGNHWLEENPFDPGAADGRLFLDQTQVAAPRCLNIGSDASAAVAEIGWSLQTTAADGTLDADSGDGVSTGNDVDAGRHYHPSVVAITAFECNTEEISWQTENATHCLLWNETVPSVIPIAARDLGAGQLAHGFSFGTKVTLVCFGSQGEPAARSGSAAGPIIHVTPTGGGEFGTSWTDALTLVEVNQAYLPPGTQVWIQEGTYVATDVEPVLAMRDGVAYYGGFAGTETAVGERAGGVTLLDGNELSYHVVTGDHRASLNGVVVARGNGTGFTEDASGSGLRAVSIAELTLEDVVFVSNHASNYGAGLYLKDGSTRLKNVALVGNRAVFSGGGLYQENETTDLENVTFFGNQGGGLHDVVSSSSLLNVTFSHNTSDNEGAGVQTRGSSLTIANATFVGNRGTQGGALWAGNEGHVELTQINLVDNTASQGGGVFASDSTVALTNGAGWGNGEDLTSAGTSTVTVRSSCSEQDLSAFGSGNQLLAASPFEALQRDGRAFLDQTQTTPPTCIDAGDDASAQAALGDWSQQTTAVDGTLDADSGDGLGVGSDVDAGRHFFPDGVAIESFSCDSTDVAWQTAHARACLLVNHSAFSVMKIPSGELASHQFAHGLPFGTQLTLICQGDQGEPAVARASVSEDLVYVTRAGGGSSGASWADALSLSELSDADFLARGTQVWIEGGAHVATDADPLLVMQEGVTYYGGFAGTEGLLSERSGPVTILDGNETCQNVVLGASQAVLDRFVITRGNAENINVDRGGGGMNNKYAVGLLIRDVVFLGNASATQGGAMFNKASQITIEKTTFVDNVANAGGGVYNLSSTTLIRESAFVHNRASAGGALYSQMDPAPLLVSCTLFDNEAVSGGAVYDSNSSPTLTNVSIYGSDAAWGGATYSYESTPVFVNVAFGGVGDDIENHSSSAPNVANSCSRQDLSSWGSGNQLLVVDPFEPALASGHLYLDQTLTTPPRCLDIGDDATATASGLDWTAQTTAADGTLDADSGDGISVGNDVDAGRHHYPDAVGIHSFTVDPTNATWATAGASSCSLLTSASSAVTAIAAGELEAGSLAHGLPFGHRATLICLGDNGEPAVANGSSSPEIIHATVAGGGTHGTSWTDALTFAEVNSALYLAPGTQVWVAEGDYAAIDENPVLAMQVGVEYYGGFAGTETELTGRAGAPSVLDGNATSTHVVRGATHGVLDGFVVTGGNAAGTGLDSYGAGMFNQDVVGLRIENVTFSDNTASGYGGGMYNRSAALAVHASAFFGNSAALGGGLYVGSASAQITDTVLVGNAATSGGGGIFSTGTSLLVTETVLLGNAAGYAGGGLNVSGESIILRDVALVANESNDDGGGMYANAPSLTLADATFFGNRATDTGGGLRMYYTTPALFDSSFLNNWSGGDGAGLSSYASTSNTVTLLNLSFRANDADGYGGGAYLQGGTITLSSTTFTENQSSRGGAGYLLSTQSSLAHLASWGNSSGVGVDFYRSSGTVFLDNSCTQQDLVLWGTGNQELDSVNPFDASSPDSGQVFLNQTLTAAPTCLDIGDDARATSDGLEWWDLTTAADGTLDADSGDGVSVGNDVDAGRHFAPDAVAIDSLAVDGTNATWTTSNASACQIFNDQDTTVLEVDSADLAVGSLAHGQTNPAAIWLICFGAAGEPAVVERSVP